MPARAGSVSIQVEGPSVVEPYESREIRSKVDGQVAGAPVEGESFGQGDLLLQLDRTELVQNVRQAEIGLSQAALARDKARFTLEKAGTDLEKANRLFSSGAIPKDQRDLAAEALQGAEYGLKSAELAVQQALLVLETARTDLSAASVRAPFDGVVLSASAAPGDLVGKGALLMVYADLSKVRLQAEVDEFDIGKIRPGQNVTVTGDALGEANLASTVERISPAAQVINNISVSRSPRCSTMRMGCSGRG